MIYWVNFLPLKKWVTITLLAVYLFNLAGYPLLFHYLLGSSGHQLSLAIDNNQYDDTELVELKVKLNLPYLNNMGGYEKADGDINIEGNIYRYVKRRVSNDTLYVLCIPDEATTRLQAAKRDYANGVNEFDSDTKAKGKDNSKKAPVFNQVSESPGKIIIAQPLVNLVHEGGTDHPLVDFIADKEGQPPRLAS